MPPVLWLMSFGKRMFGTTQSGVSGSWSFMRWWETLVVYMGLSINDVPFYIAGLCFLLKWPAKGTNPYNYSLANYMQRLPFPTLMIFRPDQFRSACNAQPLGSIAVVDYCSLITAIYSDWLVASDYSFFIIVFIILFCQSLFLAIVGCFWLLLGTTPCIVEHFQALLLAYS